MILQNDYTEKMFDSWNRMNPNGNEYKEVTINGVSVKSYDIVNYGFCCE